LKGNGFTACGKTQNRGSRGFQPPYKANKIDGGFSHGGLIFLHSTQISDFFRSLFSRAVQRPKNRWALAPEEALPKKWQKRPFCPKISIPAQKVGTPLRNAFDQVSQPLDRYGVDVTEMVTAGLPVAGLPVIRQQSKPPFFAKHKSPVIQSARGTKRLSVWGS
jgi:hypothetical protein